MKYLIRFLQYTERLAALKAHDPETYMSLVSNVMKIGVITGSLGTLWLAIVIKLLISL